VAAGDSGCEADTAIAWGVGLSHERSDVAGAESFYSLEGNMCGTAMRGAVALPGLAILTLDAVIAAEGGIPIMSGGKVIGAMGCSGGTGAQDAQVCKAGVDTIK
jgi:uncharacterized protein GlcG (DUF336 family)